MLIRQGFFDGRIKPGMEAQFYDFVRDKLMPIWQSLPGLLDIRVSKATAEDGTEYPLHTAFGFADDAALEHFLGSPERQKSRDATQILMEMFEGKIFHVVTRPLHGG
ncbi:hypothetical protein BH10PSE7_BH10PSE7_25890 [soil metagenome]